MTQEQQDSYPPETRVIMRENYYDSHEDKTILAGTCGIITFTTGNFNVVDFEGTGKIGAVPTEALEPIQPDEPDQRPEPLPEVPEAKFANGDTVRIVAREPSEYLWIAPMDDTLGTIGQVQSSFYSNTFGGHEYEVQCDGASKTFWYLEGSLELAEPDPEPAPVSEADLFIDLMRAVTNFNTHCKSYSVSLQIQYTQEK